MRKASLLGKGRDLVTIDWPSLTIFIILIKSRGHNLLIMKPIRLGFVENSLKTINKILMILITIKDIKARKHKFIFLLNELVEILNIFFVIEMISCEAVYKLKQLLFILWNRRHRSFHVRAHLLSKSDELYAQLLFIDGSGNEAVDESEHVQVFFEDQRLQQTRCLFIKEI